MQSHLVRPILLALERRDLVVGTPELRVVPVGGDREQFVGAGSGAGDTSQLGPIQLPILVGSIIVNEGYRLNDEAKDYEFGKHTRRRNTTRWGQG